MLRRLLQLSLRVNYPAAGLFVLLLFLWFCVVFSWSNRWVMDTARFHVAAGAELSDQQIIDARWPYRLIQPQWLSEGDADLLLIRWSGMELLARLGVCVLITHLLAFFTLQLVKRLIHYLGQRSPA